MKCDMGGAATVTAALALTLTEGLSHPVELILCCAENMISGHAYLPGNILRYKNGVTVEVINTDAEGRLVLADGFIKAQENKPELIIDAATLTGASQIAVGTDFCSVFSQNNSLRNRALEQAEQAHENLWPLPLETWHQDLIPSIVADTVNAYTVQTPGGASIAAGFLSRFVEPKQKWLHYDLSNVFHVNPTGMWAGGATGSMIRSIAGILQVELGS
jgi:PepB aminopeptidase